jgi:excisionase family DNA binding protein
VLDRHDSTTSSFSERIALSAEEVALLLGISRAHVFRLASSGRLPRSVRLGRAVRWDRTTLEAWLTAGAPPRDRWEAMQADTRPSNGARRR